MSLHDYFSSLYELEQRIDDTAELNVSILATWLYLYEHFYLNDCFRFTVSEYIDSCHNSSYRELASKIHSTFLYLCSLGLLQTKTGEVFSFSDSLITHKRKFK
jgi:hypothetical protein